MDISTSISTGILMKHDIEIDLSLDYHAHILPGCDHGSDGLETSLKQVAMAASAGEGTRPPDSAWRRGADMRWDGEAGRAFPPVL